MRCFALFFAIGLCSCAAPLPLPPSLLLAPQDREPVPQPVEGRRLQPTQQEGEASSPDDPNALTLAVGVAYWDELGELSTAGTGLTPDQLGEFDRGGLSFDLGYEHVVGHIGELPWSLGLEWGLAAFDNEGEGIDRFADSVGATWMHITPTAHVAVPLSDKVRFVPGIGLGAYYLSIDEYDQDFFGRSDDSRTLHDEWAFGGFVDLGFDFELFSDGTALRIDNEFHWMDFDQIDRLLPAESHVGGLVYALQLGLVFRF